MRKMKQLLACLMLLALLCGCTTAEETVTISKEEYESLLKYQKLEDVLAVIESAYLWEYDVDELIEGAAQGMIGALGDDYSYYYTAQDVEETEEAITGEYGGLGIEVFANANDLTITVRRVFYGSPAQECGLRPNDKIIAVEGEEMTAYDLDKAVSMMRGEVGGEVTLTILRESEIFDVVATRAIVQNQIIDTEILEDNIGYVRIHYFEGGLDVQFAEAVEKFQAAGVEALVIDLRDNHGGFLNLAYSVADTFIGEDTIYGSEDKYGRKLNYYGNEEHWDIPLVVLINEYSASSAEVLTAALCGSADAVTVGTKSFGKGIVQMVHTFPDGVSGMQITSEYWLTPEGEHIHGEGIVPDVEVELPEDAFDEDYNLVREKDTQLQAALDVIAEMLQEDETAQKEN